MTRPDFFNDLKVMLNHNGPYLANKCSWSYCVRGINGLYSFIICSKEFKKYKKIDHALYFYHIQGGIENV